MANDNDSVDSNGNSTDLRPRRSNRAKGKPIQQLEETDENLVIHNNIVYKVGDFVYYLEKKQDVYRIGLIEELKHQKRDKLVNKRTEISLKQFYRLDEIPASVLSNQGEYDTHVLPPNFPEWLRQRELFISDNALSTSCSSLRSLCTVRHFPDLSHAMALFSSAPSSGQVTNSSPRIDHHTLITGKDNGCIPIPKQRDDNTFFYVYSYNSRGRKLAATYLEIRVGPAYQAELPALHSTDEQINDSHYIFGAWEQLMWKPNHIPEEVFNVYHMATTSIACFSGFGGGVDDTASVENGRKIANHMLTCQRALDCLHKSQYIMEKAIEIFAENCLPEGRQMPFLWTDEDHNLFDESVKVHGKNFLRIMQDKRNKKGRLVGDFVTFYYYWKKNRPKNRKYSTKKNLRNRSMNTPLSEQTNSQEGNDLVKKEPIISSSDNTGDNQSTSDASTECCSNCKVPLPKPEEEASPDSDKSLLSERMKFLCCKCQHYLRRYGCQKQMEIVDKIKTSDDEDEIGDFEDGTNGFDEEDDEEEVEGEGEEDDDDELFPMNNSPQNGREIDDSMNKCTNQSTNSSILEIKNSMAINKYDFDEEDENVEEISSLLKRNQAKQNLLRESGFIEFHQRHSQHRCEACNIVFSNFDDQKLHYFVLSNQQTKRSHLRYELCLLRICLFFPDTIYHILNTEKDSKTPGFKPQNNGPAYLSTKTLSNYSSKPTTLPPTVTSNSQAPKPSLKLSDCQTKPNKRGCLLKKSSNDVCKKLKLQTNDDNSVSRSSSVNSRNSILNPCVRKHIHDSLKSLAQSDGCAKKLDGKKSEMNSSQYDSNSSTSSSSSTSNDSASSSDEGGTLSLIKLSSNNGKFTNIKLEASNDLKLETSKKDFANTSYNQMITSIPNIPGVCAVTNVGEPMPHLMQNLSSDLSASQSSSGSDLNIIVAEPLYKQLSLRNNVATASTSTIPNESVVGINNTATQPTTSIQTEYISKFVNFNSFANQKIDGTLEETGLNLVKPKKRTDSSLNEHNWAPAHENPSKLVHHRGDNFMGESSIIDAPKQMINDYEVIHGSIFGHIVRFIKSGDGCARTDFQHTTLSLKPIDLENKRTYISRYRDADVCATSTNGTVPATVSQDVLKKPDDIKKPCSMPPPIEKNLVHHPATSKNFPIPSLSHSSNIPGSGNPMSVANQSSHTRKVNVSSSHGLRSPSPANGRPQNSFSSISSNMIRPNQMHNANLHNLTNQASSVRPNMHMHPNMQSVSNSPLLESYEEMAKQQELYMMYNMTRPIQWDQRFGSNNEAWSGGISGPGVLSMGPGGVSMNSDLQSILRAIGQTQPVANAHNRPRSATGLNLTNVSNPLGAGGSGPPAPSGDKPGSGRASVNHEFPRALDPSQMTDSPELLETIRRLMADQMCQRLFDMAKTPSANMHHPNQPPTNPPVAHALNNLPFPCHPGQHMTLPQTFLSQMQQASLPASLKTSNPSFALNAPNQRTAFDELYQMFINSNLPR